LRNEGKDVSTSRLPKTCKRKEGTQPNHIPGNIDVSTRTQQVLHLESEENSSMWACWSIPSLLLSHLDLGFQCILISHEFNPKFVEKEKE